jgi:O-antigen/teichoic acid export membrane protein
MVDERWAPCLGQGCFESFAERFSGNLMGILKIATYWSALERFGSQGVQFLILIVLARLLSPQDFGLIGMLAVFCCLGEVFADCGLATVLIQRPANSADDESTAFYLNVGAGALFAVFLCAVSPWVAGFFGQPILLPMLCVMSLQVLFSSLGIIQASLMSRAMDFRRQAIINTVSTLFSGCLGIGMALSGFGVWSLAGQFVTAAMVRSLLFWKFGRWRPSGSFNSASLRAIWSFSSKLLLSNLITSAFENIYSVFIGRIYPPAELGYYTRATSFSQFFPLLVTSIFGRTSFAAFARMQDDIDLLKSSARKVFRLFAAVHFPVMAGLAVTAGPLVTCLVTDKWAPCVPYLRILAIMGMLYPFNRLHLNLIVAKGRSDLFLKLEGIKNVLTILVLLSTFKFGVFGIVLGRLGCQIVCLACSGYYVHKVIRYTWAEQLTDIITAIINISLMVCAVQLPYICKNSGIALHFLNLKTPLTLLFVQVTIGLLVYGTLATISKNTAYVDLRSQVSSIWHSLRIRL